MTFNRRYSPRTHALIGKDPLPAIDAEPRMTICINKQWIPFLTGVLEVLATPHYWEDPDTQVPQVEALIAELGKDNVGPCGIGYKQPNWRLDIWGDGDPGEDWARWSAAEYDFTNSHFYIAWANLDVLSGVAELNMEGFTAPGFQLAGGKIRQISLSITGNVVAPAGTFVWVDCLGNTGIEIMSGNTFTKYNFDAKSIRITHTDSFVISIVIEGDYLCAVA